MIEFSERPINILEKVRTVYPEVDYNIQLSNDQILIEKKDGTFSSCIVYSDADLQAEFVQTKYYTDYIISGEGFLSFILIDGKNSTLDASGIRIDGAFKGSIKKSYSSYSLIMSNFDKVIDVSKVQAGEENNLEEIVRDNVVVCELRLDDTSIVISEEYQIEKMINSLLSHLSFSKQILLTNPRYIVTAQGTMAPAPTGDLLVKNIKDDEPMHYFLSAEKLEYPHLQYLEYYHVLEYYFLHKRIEDIEKIIKEVVSIELSNNKKFEENLYYQKITELMGFYFNREDSGESSQLKYVITNDLGYNLIKDIINENNINPTFLKEPVFEIDETKIDMQKVLRNNKLLQVTDSAVREGFCDGLSRRIYKIRNTIVHTKKFEKRTVFVPNNKNFDSLKNDINLIRLLSFTLMTKK